MSRPVVAIRTDYGATTGYGHLRRCLTLAQSLRSLGADACFFLSADSGTSAPPGGMHGFAAVEVDASDSVDLGSTIEGIRGSGARALVVDSYRVRPEALSRPEVPRVALVDHVPDSPLPVDILVNGSIDAADAAVPALPSTRVLLGPTYMLLRAEFSRQSARDIPPEIRRVLVTTGGSDVSNLSVTFVQCVRETLSDAAVDVIVGPYFEADTVAELERASNADHNIVLHRNPPDIRAIMLACDVALTGGGQTTYELAATGMPAIAVSVADNQAANLHGLVARGALLWAGAVGDPGLPARCRAALRALAQSCGARRDMSLAASTVVDGRGADRVAAEILKLCREDG